MFTTTSSIRNGTGRCWWTVVSAVMVLLALAGRGAALGGQGVPGAIDPSRSPTRFPELGLRLEELTPELARRFELEDLEGGLVVRGVEPGSPADRAGLEIGTAITDAGGRPTRTLPAFRAAIAHRAPGRDLILRVRRGPEAGFRVILAEMFPDSSRTGH
jgi:S1-C subfamily serine protease